MKFKKYGVVLGLFCIAAFSPFYVYGDVKEAEELSMWQEGEYQPSVFSWSGGTGRVDITCEKVTIRKEKAYARIAFSSDSYGYVKVGEDKYMPLSADGESVFEIPVSLEENTKILGMTTKMSQAHEISYQIYVSLEGEAREGLIDSKGTTLDETAPMISGLLALDDAPCASGKYVRLFPYQDGIFLLEADLMTDTAREEADFENAEGMDKNYQMPIVRYILAPENTCLPAGIEKEAVLIQRPITAAYTASLPAVQALEEIHALDKITAGDLSKEVPSSLKDKGEDLDIGSYKELDYQQLLKRSCRLAIFPEEVLPLTEETSPKQEDFFQMTQEQLSILEIPLLVHRAFDEKDHDAWKKIYAVIFD